MGRVRLRASEVVEAFRAAGFELGAKQVQGFLVYHSELLAWNKRAGLVSHGDETRILIRHFLESSLLLRSDNAFAGSRVLDLGSGGGFPGVPLRILVPNIRLTLLDSKKWKVLFLRHLIKCLSLSDVRVVHERAEKLSAHVEHAGLYDIVVSRAVMGLVGLFELAGPLLKRGGVLLAIRGESAEQEVVEFLETHKDVRVEICPMRQWAQLVSRKLNLVTIQDG